MCRCATINPSSICIEPLGPIIVIPGVLHKSPDNLVCGITPSLKQSPVNISTWLLLLVGPRILTFSIAPLGPQIVTVSLHAY